LEDAAIATSHPDGTIKIKQTHKKDDHFALKGGSAGLIAGFLLGGPVLGLTGGATAGAIMGSMKDYGIDDDFIEDVSKWVQPDTSALFLLVKEAKADELLEKLRPFKATILTTTLPKDGEDRLRDALADEEFNT
jgi:uncharacterized membrane protein